MSSDFRSGTARLQFTRTGAGLPVVFLHPTPLDGRYWGPLVQRLSGVDAIVADLRGHGGSELGTGLPVGGFARVPDAPVLTMERLAEDTLALLDHEGIEKAVFAGCSIGGYVMLELWRRAPRRMRGLAFVCSKPQPDAETNLAKRVENIARVRAEGVDGLFDGMAHNLVGQATRERDKEIAKKLLATMRMTPEALVAVQAGLATRPDSLATVTTIDVPVLAIAGAEDATASPAEMEAFRKAPGGCEFHVVEGAGHFAAYERPDAVAALMEPWLGRLG